MLFPIRCSRAQGRVVGTPLEGPQRGGRGVGEGGDMSTNVSKLPLARLPLALAVPRSLQDLSSPTTRD